MNDAHFMRAAIDLARAQVGRTGENPAVGCVIVRNGTVVSQGATADGGRPHAEETAVDAAAGDVRDATAYVTLEPCAQRSSGALSCSERLISAGVSRVVIACEDASVLAAGRGVARLEAAGIVVTTGVLRDEASALYATYRPRS